MLVRSLLLFFGISLLFACQSDSSNAAKENAATEVFSNSTKPLFARFYLRYLDRDKRLKATVNFYEQSDGQQKGLQLANDVLLDGSPMEFKNLRDLELRYENLIDIPAKEQFNFQFQTLDGQQQNYQASLPLIQSFGIQAGIKKSTGFVLEAVGTPLADNEVLLLMFTDGDRHTETINIFGPMDLANMPVSAAAIKNLNTGRNELRMIRKGTTKIKEKNYSGLYNAEYYSDAIIVEVEE